VSQKLHLAILRIEVTRASRGLSAIAELLVFGLISSVLFKWLAGKYCARVGH